MHTTYLLKRYILVAAICMVALEAIGYGLSMFLGIELGASLGIVSAIVPAIDAGQVYAKRWEKPPKSAYAWKLSAAFTLINLCVGAALMLVVFAYFGEFAEMWRMIKSMVTPFFAIIMSVVLAIYWGANRFFFGFGAKIKLKDISRAG